jgi:hypothetical protein
MNHRVIALNFTFVGLMLLNCCNKVFAAPQTNDHTAMNNYDRTIQSGLQNCPDFKAFKDLFPGATHVISYYTGQIGPPKWTSQIGLYGRYIFRISAPIELDADRLKIQSMGPLELHFYEIEGITSNPNGTFSIQVKSDTRLSRQKWRQLLVARGNFTAVGILLETNKPLTDFANAWQKF